MTAITKKKNTVKKKNPTKPGLYQILSANSRSDRWSARGTGATLSEKNAEGDRT